jgi:hypothetical protein
MPTTVNDGTSTILGFKLTSASATTVRIEIAADATETRRDDGSEVGNMAV